jgi:nucleoside-diphosphate-sugar epimerase
MNKKVLITGATGMIGQMVLQHCLASEEIGEVISITRKTVGITNPKLKEIIHADFLHYENISDAFVSVHAAYFCIGVYTGALPDAQFKEITVGYTKAFADALHAQSPQAVFCFLSGQGADLTEKSKTSFARYKGMAENYLMSKCFGGLVIFRPGYIYPVEKRKEPNMAYRIFRMLYPLLKNILGKNASIKSTELAEAIFRAGLQQPKQVILENKDILNVMTSLC